MRRIYVIYNIFNILFNCYDNGILNNDKIENCMNIDGLAIIAVKLHFDIPILLESTVS